MAALVAVGEIQSGEMPSVTPDKDTEEPKSDLQENTQPEGVSSNEKCPWLVGDIVWSKIPGHPWWPSMIAYEPNTAVYFKMKGRTKYYHVQFFGTEPMRGWSTEKNIVQYEGKSHFLSLRLSVHGQQHKIGTKQVPLWEHAVKMADKALPLNRHQRKLCFTFKYEEKSESDEVPVNEKDPSVSENKKSKVISTPKSGKKRIAGSSEEKNTKDSSTPKSVKKKLCNGSETSLEPPNKRIKIDNKAQESTPKHKVKQQPVVQSPKSPDHMQINNKPTKDNCIVVNHSSTSCTIKMNITPETGKRKRGRPRKNLLFVGKGKPDIGLVKKPKKVLVNSFPNNITSSAESEKSDFASDTNSTSSTDNEKVNSRSSSKPKENICTVCEEPDNLLICEGICNSAYHKDCIGLTLEIPKQQFICDECTSGNHTCFICRKTSNVIKCSSDLCGKFYHLDCIKERDPKINSEKFICPLHYCNVCGASKSASSKKRLATCTRCPVAYHSGTCIVAGSLPITSQHLVCKRHFLADKKKAHHSHVNVNWCFVCSIGGTLICCESCPAAFHPECIEEVGIPEGCFYCRDCKNGKELLYGEIVWVKLGMYRWWPALICNPNNIPTNIQRMQHQPGEFPVQFLGSHDYYWIHRGRVFSYQEGDKGSSINNGGKYLAGIFKKALVEAKEKYAEWQTAQEEKAEKDLQMLSRKPAVYKHIKVNRYTTATRLVVDEPEWSTCDCSYFDQNPCGPDTHCINRILFVECSPLKCHAKEKCQNQCFVKRQNLKCEPVRAERRGWGLKALADAQKGQFVIEYVGELINEETCRERVRKGINEGVINYYMLTIDKDCIIDAGPMGNLSRFMNHSCDPNCETQKWKVNGEVRVGLFAKRDIEAGEELTFDYQLDCLGNEKKKCSCGSENCSGFLGVRPKTQHAMKLQEEKKTKKKKKKIGNKKHVTVDGARCKHGARGLVPGDLGSSECNEDCDVSRHFDLTPEAFPALQLEFDEQKIAIERILLHDNKADYEKHDTSIFKTATAFENESFNQECYPSSQPSCSSSHFLAPTLASGFISSITTPNARLPSLSHNIRIPQPQKSLPTNTTLSQFTPKDPPVVTRGFPSLDSKVQLPMYRPLDHVPDIPLAVESISQLDEHEDECFDCGDGGELIMCSKNGCSKCYHLSCLTLDKIPHGDWICPWHFCDDCGKAATLRCEECSNSFCHAHGKGQITKMVDGRFLCEQHPESGLDTSESNPVAESPINTSTDPTNTTKDPSNTSSDPSNTLKDPTNSTSDPSDTLKDPSNTPKDPNSNSPNDHPNTLDAPSSIPKDPNSNIPKKPTDDPTSVPENPIIGPAYPASYLDVPADISESFIADDELTENPISIPKDPLSVPLDPTSASQIKVKNVLDGDPENMSELSCV